MNQHKNYKHTLISCYLGFITQAITANFVPLLFLTFKNTYSISLELIALIPFVFYLSQLIIDLLATKFADKIGYRVCVIASQILSSLGLVSMVFLPEIIPYPFIGILISVVLYAIGSGLIEVLISPIVEACPFENKEGVMSLLHSFYCWGALGVILGSTLFFYFFGIQHWKILALVWAILPLANAFNFIKCPIERLTEEGQSMGVKNLLKTPIFWLMIVLMICAGASEISMAQWASAFAESALGVSKVIGDLVGPCLFVAFMGISRVLYGKFSQKLNLTTVMLICGIACVGCYLLASLSPLSIFGLVGCSLCGFTVGVMWPGSISISSQKCPKGGTAMFAFLALAGDFGGMLGPMMVGQVSGALDNNLKIGLLCASIFPMILVIALAILKLNKKNQKQL